MKAMKKILTVISIAMVIAVFAITMAGCDKSASVKSTFEKNDYTVSTVNTNNDTVQSLLKAAGMTDEQIEEINKYEVMLCTAKGLAALTGSGVVVKFPSSGDLKNFLTVEDAEGKKDTSAYDKAKEDKRINGNCLYFGSSAGKEIFNKA